MRAGCIRIWPASGQADKVPDCPAGGKAIVAVSLRCRSDPGGKLQRRHAAKSLNLGTQAWVTGSPAGCTFHLPYWTVGTPTASGLQSAVDDAEACRTALSGMSALAGIYVDIPPVTFAFSGANGLTLPQTNDDPSGAAIILRSTMDTTLPSGQIVCSHGVQDNLSTSTDIGLDNPDCTGGNMYYELGPTQAAPDNGTGTGSDCVSASMSGTTATFTMVATGNVPVTGCATTFPATSFTVGQIVTGTSFTPNTYDTRWQILSVGNSSNPAVASTMTAQACPYSSAGATMSNCVTGLANSSAAGALNADNVITGHTTLSVNTTTLTPVTSAMVTAGIPVEIPLANGYVAPGISLSVDIGGNQEAVTTVSGPNQLGMYAVFTKTHAFGAPVTFCASGCTYTLANGKTINTANYNDLQYMWQVSNTGGGNIITCSPIGTSSTSSPPACGGSTPIAPDHWVIEDMGASNPAGSGGSGDDIALLRVGSESALTQVPSHIHFRRVWAHDDWTSLFTGSNQEADGIGFDCVYCSLVDSQVSQIMRPGGEGHAIAANGTQYKFSHDWIEGGSSGLMSGGFSNGTGVSNNATFANSYVPYSDIEERRLRFTYPFAWLGEANVNKLFNPNFNESWSRVRKIAQESKNWARVVEDGNIYEGTDPSGGNYTQARGYHVRNTSGGNTGSNYNAQGHDLYAVNNIYRNTCEGFDMAGSNQSGGNGGGVSWPPYNMYFSNELLYAIDSSGTYNPYCAGEPDNYAISLDNSGTNGWTGTLTVNSTGTQATFVATVDNYTGQPVGGISGTLTAAAGSTSQTITSSAAFTNGTAWTAAANIAYNGSLYSLTGACASPSSCTVICGTTGNPACAATGSYSFTAVPLGKQAMDVGTGQLAAMWGCQNYPQWNSFPGTVTTSGTTVTLAAGTNFQGLSGGETINIGGTNYTIASSWSPISPYTTLTLSTVPSPAFSSPVNYTTTVYSAKPFPTLGYTITSGSAAWNGTFSTSNVTFAVAGNFAGFANASDATCVTRGGQGIPKMTTINHVTAVTNNRAVTTATNVANGLSGGALPNLMRDFTLSNDILLGAWGISATPTGCQTVGYMADETSLTNVPMVWPGQTQSSYSGCYENNNPNYVAPSGYVTQYFPSSASMCSYWAGSSACTTGNQNINVSDYHAFAQASGSAYHNTAADGADFGSNIPSIDAAETANQFVCPYRCGGQGPYPDTLAVGTAVSAWYMGLDVNTTSPFPSAAHQVERLWDTQGTEWPYAATCTGGGNTCSAPYVTYTFTAMDAQLAAMYSAGVRYMQMPLARTPNFASSRPSDTSCNYYVSGSTRSDQLAGQCDPPSDLNTNGTGANLYWRNWVAALATHVNAPGYLNSHARLLIYETWNEPYVAGFFSGTYDQLVRMEQDAYCIIKGGSFTIAATGETCAQVRAAVTSVSLSGPVDPTAYVVMPSYNGLNTAKAQAFLYCTGSAAGSSSCHNGGAAQTDAINFHLKPGGTSLTAEAQMDQWVSATQAVLQPAELAKPLFNTEGGYNGGIAGWGAPYTDPNMQASFIGRFYIYSLQKGISNSEWYDWDANNGGLGSTTANTAYGQVESWLAGATFGSCTTGVPGTAGGGLFTYSCTLTLVNGTQALAIWDNSQSCSDGTCTTTNQTVAGQYTSYLTLAGGSATPIIGNQVPVGIEPLLLLAGTP